MKFKDRYVLCEGWFTYDEEDRSLFAFKKPTAGPKDGIVPEIGMKYPKILDRNEAPKYRLVLERVDQSSQPCAGVNCK